MSTARRFDTFLSNISLTDAQKTEGASKRESVVQVLNRNYYNNENRTSNSKFVGSWGKFTRVRPPRDVDVLFTLPPSVHSRFENRTGNRQSQLLQEVRSVLGGFFYNTAVKGDGPVVIVPFASCKIELIPAFVHLSGGYQIALTANGGSYKREDYDAQSLLVSSSNMATNGNTRHLIKMMKRWQSYCSVPLKSFLIELLVVQFIEAWGNRGKSSSYYDWMCRDFFEYLYNKQNSYVVAPGTSEILYTGTAWASRAETALQRARRACNHELASEWALAGDEWQKIFGTDIPKYV